MENEKCTLQDLEYGENTEICGILKVYTVGPGIWRETLKTMENEKFTLQDLGYGKHPEKRGK